MTLDRAIVYYDELTKAYCEEADLKRDNYMDMRDKAYEYEQLAEWLKELRSLRERNEKMYETLSEKMAYMCTCPNERDIILGIVCGKGNKGINHCNTDCWNTKCESYHYEEREK